MIICEVGATNKNSLRRFHDHCSPANHKHLRRQCHLADEYLGGMRFTPVFARYLFNDSAPPTAVRRARSDSGGRDEPPLVLPWMRTEFGGTAVAFVSSVSVQSVCIRDLVTVLSASFQMPPSTPFHRRSESRAARGGTGGVRYRRGRTFSRFRRGEPHRTGPYRTRPTHEDDLRDYVRLSRLRTFCSVRIQFQTSLFISEI